MVKILRETDRTPVAEVAKKHGISEQTIYVWKRRFGTMTGDEARRLRSLEARECAAQEAARGPDLEIEVMKEVESKKW